MPQHYRLYHVISGTVRPGQHGAAAMWWREKGRSFFLSLPGVRGVQAYAPQFGLGSTALEIWLELENYAAYDRGDKDMAANPEKYGAFDEMEAFLDVGPSRLMGEWPGSDLEHPE